jgi:hypothetical protein
MAKKHRKELHGNKKDQVDAIEGIDIGGRGIS